MMIFQETSLSSIYKKYMNLRGSYHHRMDGIQHSNLEFKYYVASKFSKGFYLADDIGGKTPEVIRIINGYTMKNHVGEDII
jgi:hypothetical protein